LTEQWKALTADLRGEFSTYRIELKHAYPDVRGLILPTRLGNVIRSFEYYSHREYVLIRLRSGRDLFLSFRVTMQFRLMIRRPHLISW
jgi:hypothetical protein